MKKKEEDEEDLEMDNNDDTFANYWEWLLIIDKQEDDHYEKDYDNDLTIFQVLPTWQLSALTEVLSTQREHSALRLLPIGLSWKWALARFYLIRERALL